MGITTTVRLRDRVLRAGGWVTAGFVLDKFIAVAQLAILARLLTPSDFGLIAASAVTLLALMTLSEMGIESALVARREVSDTDLAVAWSLSICRASVLTVGLWCGAGLIAEFFRAPELGLLLRVHACALLLQSLQSPALAVLLKQLDLGGRVRLDLCRRVIEVVVSIGLAYWLRDAWALLGGQLTGFAVGSVLSYRVAPWAPRLSFDQDVRKYFVHYAKHLNLTSVLIFGVMSGGEFVVGRTLGTGTLGMYQIALGIPLLLGTRLALLINQVSFPAYAVLQNDNPGMRRALALQLGVLATGLIPLACGVAVFAPEIVNVLFGPQWLAAGDALRILSLFAVCAGLSGVMASLHYGLNRPDIQTRIWMMQFGVYAAVILPFTSWFELTGAAGALSLSMAFGLVLHIRYTIRLMGNEAIPIFLSLGRVAVSTLLGVVGILLFFNQTTGQMSRWLVFGMVLSGASAYAYYLWRIEYPRLTGLWQGK